MCKNCPFKKIQCNSELVAPCMKLFSKVIRKSHVMLTLFVNIYFYKEEEIEIVPFTHPSNSVYFTSRFRILETISAGIFLCMSKENEEKWCLYVLRWRIMRFEVWKSFLVHVYLYSICIYNFAILVDSSRINHKMENSFGKCHSFET